VKRKGCHDVVESPQYQNCQVLHPNGQLMFRCSEKKATWYLDRNLGVKLGDNPLVVKLSFIPKGDGHIGDPYHLQEMENKCVVCGCLDYLTRHHIVPYCYRRFFSDKVKNHRAYDVMAMCSCCHHAYEREADCLKEKIGEEHGMPVNGTGIKYDKDAGRAKNAAHAILVHGDKIPPDRLTELYLRVSTYLGREVGQEDLNTLTTKELYNFKSYVHHGQYVVSKMAEDQIEPFVRKWRQHFIDTMQPKFLPKNWTVDRSILYKV
jgi:hypothetical protein